MRKIIKIIVYLLVAVSTIPMLSQCVKTPPSVDAFLTVTQEFSEPFDPAGGSEAIVFSTNEEWDITLEPSAETKASVGTIKWCEVTPLSGSAGEDISVSVNVQANEEYSPRGFVLVLRTKSFEKRIEVTQLKKNAIILSGNSIKVSLAEQLLKIQVKSNVEYSIDIKQGADWISEAPQARSGGLTDTEHSFKISANTLSGERTGIIVFRDANSDLFDEVTIVQSAPKDVTSQRLALVALYDEAGGSGWTHKENWCSDKPLDQWYGVQTDKDGNVIALRLPKNNLTGTISWELSKLTELQHLDLSRNSLRGDIAKLGTDGSVVSYLDGLINIETIDLSRNAISGDILPLPKKSRQLKHLNLSFNKLSAEINHVWNFMFADGLSVDIVLNNNYLHGDLSNSMMSSSPNWNRLALQCIRQYPTKVWLRNKQDIYLPDFTFTDLRDGSRKSIRDVYSNNTNTMILSWDPTQEDSKNFMEDVLHRTYTLYSGLYLEIIAIIPEGDEYRKAAESYLRTHKVPYPVAVDYADANGERIILPCEPYPSYFYVDKTGKVSSDMFTGQRSYVPEDEGSIVDLIKGPLLQVVDVVEYGFPRRISKYQSTDFSMDKKYELLHKATKGKGVDIMLIGEAFTDIDIKSGVYKKVMERAMELFFSIEPTKSYREYFNIYMVYAVSKDSYVKTRENDHETALGVFRGYGNFHNILDGIRNCVVYRRAIPSDYVASVGVVVKTDGPFGLAHINNEKYSVIYDEPEVGKCDFGLGFTSIDRFTQLNSRVFVHETVGHAFGLFQDEYKEPLLGKPNIPTQREIKEINEFENAGIGLNLSFVNDPKAVRWAHLIGHPKYPEAGLYEGGLNFTGGIWRSEDMSLMGSDGYYFSAYCREVIVKRIMELAGEEYTFEKFLQKDVIESKKAPTKLIQQQLNQLKTNHRSPTIMDRNLNR